MLMDSIAVEEETKIVTIFFPRIFIVHRSVVAKQAEFWREKNSHASNKNADRNFRVLKKNLFAFKHPVTFILVLDLDLP